MDADILDQIKQVIYKYNEIYKDIEDIEGKLKNLSLEREAVLKDLESNRLLEQTLLEAIKKDPNLKKEFNVDNIYELYKQLLDLKINN